MFQLNLHIPYFEIRRFSNWQGERNTQQCDLTFLSFPTDPKFPSHRRYMMIKSQFSLVISGLDDRHWTAYAFVDRDFDKDEDLDMDFSYRGIQEDPIASDCGPYIIDANMPIWDPRVYFLRIFEIRIRLVCKEWASLYQTIRCKLEYYVSQGPFLL
jgi:hypothetical protein